VLLQIFLKVFYAKHSYFVVRKVSSHDLYTLLLRTYFSIFSRRFFFAHSVRCRHCLKPSQTIIDDASTMLLTKVHQKTALVSHQHARLEATHRVLSELLEAPDDEELAAVDTKDVNIGQGVLWSTFGVQMAVALTVGAVVESWRIRSSTLPKTQRRSDAADAYADAVAGQVAGAVASTSAARPMGAVFGALN
jgi:hypothetical protein